jgi:hypothetical protein
MNRQNGNNESGNIFAIINCRTKIFLRLGSVGVPIDVAVQRKHIQATSTQKYTTTNDKYIA